MKKVFKFLFTEPIIPISILVTFALISFNLGATLSPHWMSGARELEHIKGIRDGIKMNTVYIELRPHTDNKDSLRSALLDQARDYYWSENKEQDK